MGSVGVNFQRTATDLVLADGGLSLPEAQFCRYAQAMIGPLVRRVWAPPAARGPERNALVEKLDKVVDALQFLPGQLLPRGLQKMTDASVGGVGLSPYHLLELERLTYRATSSQFDPSGRVVGPPRYLTDLFGPTGSAGSLPAPVGASRASEWVGLAAASSYGPLAQAALMHCWQEARQEEIARHLSFSEFRNGPQRPHSNSEGRQRTLVLFEQKLRSLDASEGSLERCRERYQTMVEYLEQGRPWLETHHPRVAEAVEQSLVRLTPSWTERGNEDLLGWRVKAGPVYQTYEKLTGQEKLHFALALDAQILSLEKSFWLKLLDEGSPEQRKAALEPLVARWEGDPSAENTRLAELLLRSLKVLNQAERQPYVERLRSSAPPALKSQLDGLGWRSAEELKPWLASSQQTVILGPYWPSRSLPQALSEVRPQPREGLALGQRSQLSQSPWALSPAYASCGEAVPLTLVLEGGGGKGFAFAPMLRGLMDQLSQADGSFKLDSFCGTSAGAITATLLAAGYSPEELEGIMSSLPFREFFSDAHALTTGDDPAAGAASRISLFTTRRMEESLRRLLQEKLQIFDRPVTFQDLPFGLKMPSTVLAGNLPDDLLAQLQYQPATGQVVFSQETTPLMDVAAAASASGAFPFNFQPPMLEFTRVSPQGQLEQYWLQVTDGGVVNNFPLDLADQPGESSCKLVLPTPYEDLSTLGFDPGEARSCQPAIEGFYGQNGPALRRFLASRPGGERLVVGLDLQKKAAPVVVLSEDPRHAEEARQVGLDTGCAREWARQNGPQAPGWLQRRLLGDRAEMGDQPVETIAGMLRNLTARQLGAAEVAEFSV